MYKRNSELVEIQLSTIVGKIAENDFTQVYDMIVKNDYVSEMFFEKYFNNLSDSAKQKIFEFMFADINNAILYVTASASAVVENIELLPEPMKTAMRMTEGW